MILRAGKKSTMCEITQARSMNPFLAIFVAWLGADPPDMDALAWALYK
jgi:hypothetical protein